MEAASNNNSTCGIQMSYWSHKGDIKSSYVTQAIRKSSVWVKFLLFYFFYFAIAISICPKSYFVFCSWMCELFSVPIFMGIRVWILKFCLKLWCEYILMVYFLFSFQWFPVYTVASPFHGMTHHKMNWSLFVDTACTRCQIYCVYFFFATTWSPVEDQ